jgi:hypothetical protein
MGFDVGVPDLALLDVGSRGRTETGMCSARRSAGMAPEKIDVKRAEDDKANAAKLAMLKELAKAAKPIGVETKEEPKKGKK